jgi:hypothetical protein
MLWIAPASAADLAVTACQPDANGMRSIVYGKKALTSGRPLFVQRSTVQTERTASARRDRQVSDRSYSDTWYRRHFALVIGVGY